MRLYEITAPPLFLCTNARQKVGGIVTMDKSSSWLGDVLEAVLEANRPANSLPRARSLILHTAPQGTDYTYIVRPEGLERLHSGWLNKLADVDPAQPGVQTHYAIGYWGGTACPEAKEKPWEYRVAAAHVLSRFGGSGRDLAGLS